MKPAKPDQPFTTDRTAAGPDRRRRRGGAASELFSLLVGVAAYTVAGFAVIFMIAGLLSWLVGSPLLGFVNVLTAVVLIPAIAMSVASVRRRRAAAVLGYLQQAVRLNLPLPRLLAAAAASERGPLSRRIDSLRAILVMGIPLGEAVATTVPEMPDRTVDLIEFGLRNGQLGPALDRLTSESLEHSRRQRNDFPFATWYPLVLLSACGGAVALIAVFVLPKFMQIFHSFGMPVPASVLWLEQYEDLIWIGATVAAGVLLVRLGFQLRKIFQTDPPVAQLRHWSDQLAWRTPVLHGLVRNRNLGDLCLSLADTVRAGHPLDILLNDSARLSLNDVLRNRILAWAERLRAGVSPADAARAARMPGLVVGMIATARDNDGLADAFAFLGRFYRDRFSLKREALRAAFIPFFTITIGIFVMAVELTLFVPMRDLILKLSW